MSETHKQLVTWRALAALRAVYDAVAVMQARGWYCAPPESRQNLLKRANRYDPSLQHLTSLSRVEGPLVDYKLLLKHGKASHSRIYLSRLGHWLVGEMTAQYSDNHDDWPDYISIRADQQTITVASYDGWKVSTAKPAWYSNTMF